MPSARESIMETAFPKAAERFTKILRDNPWRLLFEALNAKAVTGGSAGRLVRFISEEIDVDGLPVRSTVRETSATTRPNARVESVFELDKGRLLQFERDIESVNGLREWLEDVPKAGNRALFVQMKSLLSTERQVTCPLRELELVIDMERRALGAESLHLLVSEFVRGKLSAESEPAARIRRALRGGKVLSVPYLYDKEGFLLRGGAGDVCVDLVRELALQWDVGVGRSGAVLIALEEFVVVAEGLIPASWLTLEETGETLPEPPA